MQAHVARYDRRVGSDIEADCNGALCDRHVSVPTNTPPKRTMTCGLAYTEKSYSAFYIAAFEFFRRVLNEFIVADSTKTGDLAEHPVTPTYRTP